MNLIVCCGIQKAYLSPKGSRYLGEKSDILDVRLKEYFKTLNLQENIVYLIREVHQPDDTFFLNKKSGSLVGSDDIEIPEFYKAYSKLTFNVMRYNAFYQTPLDSEVYKLKPSNVTIIGLETHTTVLFTAEEFRNRGYKVTVIEPLVTASDDYLHALGITLLHNILNVDTQLR
jgi:nicotinamidase-related amidase